MSGRAKSGDSPRAAAAKDICTSLPGGVTLWPMNKYPRPSASHSDKELTRRLANELEAAGHKVWLSQGLGDGADQLDG